MQSPAQKKNADRFTGFADTYDRARPAMPYYPVERITAYLGRRPDTVVDLGCGTGLSTLIWQGNCRLAIGIEPSEDMLRLAKERETADRRFQQGFGSDTGLPDACCDAVVCSRSFHWMEPVSTLREVNRILKPGGVFATVDCDWPPVIRWEAEQAYMTLYEKVRVLEKALPDVQDTFVRYEKEQRLANIRSSGYFRYCRELLFSNPERCTAERLMDLLFSQGSLHTLQKLHPEKLEAEIAAFRSAIAEIFPDPAAEFPIAFCYRMRIAVK